MTLKTTSMHIVGLWRKLLSEVVANTRAVQQKRVNNDKRYPTTGCWVILHNVQWMSRKLKDLQERGHPVNAEILKALSPYRREHINRFGDYLLDLQRRVPPLDPSIDFVFKSAA